MAPSLMSTISAALIHICIKISNSNSVYLNPQADLTFRISPENFVLRVPTSEAVAQFLALSTQASDVVRQIVPHELDIRYGAREQQLLDIYGKDLPPGSPIFVYLHGGVWSVQEVTKGNSAYPVLPLWRAGVKVVVGEYDLAPNVTLGIMVEEIRELTIFVLQMAETENCRNVWIGGHSAGAHLVSKLLQAEWYNRLNPELKGRIQGVVLISGLYDLTPFLFLELNSVLKLDRKSAIELSPALSKGSVLRVPHPVNVFLITAQQDAPVYHNQTDQYYPVIKKQHGINTIFLNVPGLGIDHYSNVVNLQYPNCLLTKNIVGLITRSII